MMLIFSPSNNIQKELFWIQARLHFRLVPQGLRPLVLDSVAGVFDNIPRTFASLPPFMPMLEVDPSVCLWLPSSTNGSQIREAVKGIMMVEIKFSRLIVVLDESSLDSPDKDSKAFGDYYWMIRDAYKGCLKAMTVEEGLKIDLQVFIYPDYLSLSLLLESFPTLALYCPENMRIPVELQGLVRRSVKLSPAIGAFTPILKQHEEFNELRPCSFNVVALGGTFDRLHAGHKLMISSAIILAKQTIVFGLTDSSMLASKKHLQVLLPYEKRKEELMRFVKTFVAGRIDKLGLEVVALHDPYGPTITTPQMDVLVVSEETLPGAQQINLIRKEKGMTELRVVPVEFVKLSSGERISSSLIRSHYSGV